MRHNNGFTLVELLVVIVILGIITGISIPLIRNLQQNNEMKKYTTYMDSIKYSAKLYVDSYSEDLFGHDKTGCAIIKYSQLEEKGLLKDISIDDVSCNSEDTYVKVVKIDNKVGYSTTVGCGKKKNDGTVQVETQLPEGGLIGIETCGSNASTIISFETAPVSSNAINYQRMNVTVKAISHTGFHEDMSISYAFIKKENKPIDEAQAPSSSIVGGWKSLDMNYVGGNEQKRMIENGDAVILSSNKITTPDNVTGEYYVVLKIDTLKDLAGRDWTTDPSISKYQYRGPFKVDNTKPVFADSSTVVSSEAAYNSLSPKLNISVTDNYSSNGDLRMCTSYDSDSCSKKVEDIKKKQNNWITYDGNKVLNKIQDNYDGSTHTVYVSVADAAGNYETKNYSYKLEIPHTLSYDGNGNTGGSTSSTICIEGVDCTLSSNGFTKTGYTFDGWYNAASGGTKYGETTRITTDTTVYAHWKPNNYTIVYHGNGNTGGSMENTICTYDSDCNLRTNGFTLDGYKVSGWAKTATGSIAYGAGSTVRNLATSGTVDLYAIWEENKCEFVWHTYTYLNNTGCHNRDGGSWNALTGVIGETDPFDASKCKEIKVQLNYEAQIVCNYSADCWGGQYYGFSVAMIDATTGEDIARDGGNSFWRGMSRHEDYRVLDLSSYDPSLFKNAYLQISAGLDCTDTYTQYYGFYENPTLRAGKTHYYPSDGQNWNYSQIWYNNRGAWCLAGMRGKNDDNKDPSELVTVTLR